MPRKCSLYHFETEFEEWKDISISSYKFLWFVQLHEISQRAKYFFSFWSRTAPTSLNAIAHLQVIFTFFSLPKIYSLNFQSCLHMGHWCWVCWVPSHFMIQWMWKQWLHWPHTWEIDIQQCPHTAGQQPRTKILCILWFNIQSNTQLATNQRAVVSCKFTIRAASIKSHPVE